MRNTINRIIGIILLSAVLFTPGYAPASQQKKDKLAESAQLKEDGSVPDLMTIYGSTDSVTTSAKAVGYCLFDSYKQ